jgi:hypothetical protein
METVVPKLQHPGSAADGLVHHRASETGAACPFYSPATDDVPMLIYSLVHQCADARRPQRQSLDTTKGHLER